MSDKLARILEQVIEFQSSKSDDPDQRIIDALAHALKATTPTHAGTPWDELEEDKSSTDEYCFREGE